MKKLNVLLGVFAVVGLLSCEKQLGEDETFDVGLKSALQTELKSMPTGMAHMAKATTFVAHLSGGQEVPENDSRATGQAIFELGMDGDVLKYRLIVANIEDVRMAHIHAAQPGMNGGVVAWLYPASPPPVLLPGKTNGVLAKGSIKSENLVGSLNGMEVSDLVDLIKEGGAYVNVHTENFPGGEIRGQISWNKANKYD